jgi:hypothetical protein
MRNDAQCYGNKYGRLLGDLGLNGIIILKWDLRK